MTNLELLEEIKEDYLLKFENDPAINRVCTVMINEFKARMFKLESKQKILIVGSGPSGLNAAKALALKHNNNIEVITLDQADNLGIEAHVLEMRKPKPFIIENIRVEDYLPTDYLLNNKPKYPDKKNWKRKLKKNFKRPKK